MYKQPRPICGSRIAENRPLFSPPPPPPLLLWPYLPPSYRQHLKIAGKKRRKSLTSHFGWRGNERVCLFSSNRLSSLSLLFHSGNVAPRAACHLHSRRTTDGSPSMQMNPIRAAATEGKKCQMLRFGTKYFTNEFLKKKSFADIHLVRQSISLHCSPL